MKNTLKNKEYMTKKELKLSHDVEKANKDFYNAIENALS